MKTTVRPQHSAARQAAGPAIPAPCATVGDPARAASPIPAPQLTASAMDRAARARSATGATGATRASIDTGTAYARTANGAPRDSVDAGAKRSSPATGATAALLAAVLLGIVPRAHAADAIPAGARLAATCTGCHGTNGATQGTALPSLAGQQKDSLLTALKDFKAGKRQSSIMMQLTKGYTDEQLEALAIYFAAQPKGDAK